MKKLMILAVAAIALAACSKTFDTHHHGNEGKAIGFGTWTEKLTKHTQGLSTGDEGFAWNVNDNFIVSGFKTVGTGEGAANTNVFANQLVEYKGGTPTWTYAPKRLWDPAAASYTFYAISPGKINDSDIATLDASAGTVTNCQTITFAGNNNDILVASKEPVSNTGGNFNNYHTVDLKFNHIAALFDLKVKKHNNLSSATVNVTGIELLNLKNQGTFAISGYDGSTNKPSVTWSASGSANYTSTSGVTSIPCTADNPVEATTDGALVINKLIVVPDYSFTSTGTANNSNTSDQLVKISYTINYTTPAAETITHNNVYFFLKAFDTTDNDTVNNDPSEIGSWLAGKHYTYFITIDAHTIEFTASVNNWVTGDTGYHYLVD